MLMTEFREVLALALLKKHGVPSPAEVGNEAIVITEAPGMNVSLE